jgi:hypothetical protein
VSPAAAETAVESSPSACNAAVRCGWRPTWTPRFDQGAGRGRVLFSLRLRGTSGTNGGGREGTVPRPRDESQHARFFYFLNVVRERSAQEFFLLYFFMHSGHTTPTGSCFQRRCPHPPLALGAASAAPHRPQLYCRLCS